MSDQRSPLWTRLLLGALAIPQLVTGLWAVVDPSGWFAEFPGFDPRLVSSDPPFNEHLAIDAGAGFLATGIALIVAAGWGYRRPIILALVTYLAFGIPHAIFHTFNEAPGLTSSEQVNAYLTLWLGVVVAAVVLGVTFARGEEAVADAA